MPGVGGDAGSEPGAGGDAGTVPGASGDAGGDAVAMVAGGAAEGGRPRRDVLEEGRVARSEAVNDGGGAHALVPPGRAATTAAVGDQHQPNRHSKERHTSGGNAER